MIHYIKKTIYRVLSITSWSLAKIVLFGNRYECASEEWGKVYQILRQNDRAMRRKNYLSRYQIHESVKWGYHTSIYGEGEISIGKDTYFGHNCFILSHVIGNRIIIGEHCAISHNVHIRTSVHKKEFHYRNERYGDPVGKDIIIGAYVWIGANVFINGGVTIGDNVIIGANSVVTKDITANTIWGGVPAKLIRDKKDYLYINEDSSN